jgi:hypothetical protein
MADSRCHCNASSLPHRHTKEAIVDAPDGPQEQPNKDKPKGVVSVNVGVKKPIS